MSFDPAQFVRSTITALEPYTPIQPLEVLSEQLNIPIDELIKLDANENPFGPAPGVAQALKQHPFYAIYPDPDQTRLRLELSTWLNIPPDQLLCGNGSDELIDLIMRLLLQPDDVVLACPPTFGMYRFNAEVVGARFVAVPRAANFELDPEAIRSAVEKYQARLLFLPSPNNPTGNPVSQAQLEYLLQLPVVVVMDEAYAEFSDSSAIQLVAQHTNLVVLRTFSKWAGLAGLRLGYGVFPQWMLAHLWKIKPPYNINVAAEAAAIQSLKELTTLNSRVKMICAERDRLYAALQQLPGLHPFPSAANFILCRVEQDAAQLKQQLKQQGILVRHYQTPELRDYIRISVGLPHQHDRLLETLTRLLADL